MSREIRFRAWYRGKMYHYVEHTTYPDGSNDVTLLGYLEGERVFSPGHPSELMQFTGFLDKNGKDIYEDDAIKDEYGNIYFIRWASHLAQFALYWHYASKVGSNKEWRYEDSLDPNHLKSCEIIGNIYEHPNLLEELS